MCDLWLVVIDDSSAVVSLLNSACFVCVVNIHIYVYIYTERESDREREMPKTSKRHIIYTYIEERYTCVRTSIYKNVYIHRERNHIYIYVYVYAHMQHVSI